MKKRLALFVGICIVMLVVLSSVFYYTTFCSKAETQRLDADNLVWETRLNYTLSQYTTVSGELFTTSTQGYVYGYNATTGMLLWRTNMGGNTFYCPIVESNGKLYTLGANSHIVEIDSQSGNLTRNYATPTSAYNIFKGTPSFSVEYGKLVCVYNLTDMVVFDVQSGTLLWSNDSRWGLRVYNTSFSGEGLHISYDGQGMNAVYLSNGSTAWSLTGACGNPLFTEDKVIILNYGSLESYRETLSSQGYPKEYDILCLDKATGQQLWAYTPQYLVFNPTLTANGLLFASYDGYFYKLNLANGLFEWKTQVTDLSIGSNNSNIISVSDCLIYAPYVDENGNRICWLVSSCKNGNAIGAYSFRFLSLVDGSEKWSSTPLPMYRQVFAGEGDLVGNMVQVGNRFFVGTKMERLCFDASSGSLLWSTSSPEVHDVIVLDNRAVIITGNSLVAYA